MTTIIEREEILLNTLDEIRKYSNPFYRELFGKVVYASTNFDSTRKEYYLDVLTTNNEKAKITVGENEDGLFLNIVKKDAGSLIEKINYDRKINEACIRKIHRDVKTLEVENIVVKHNDDYLTYVQAATAKYDYLEIDSIPRIEDFVNDPMEVLLASVNSGKLNAIEPESIDTFEATLFDDMLHTNTVRNNKYEDNSFFYMLYGPDISVGAAYRTYESGKSKPPMLPITYKMRRKHK